MSDRDPSVPSLDPGVKAELVPPTAQTVTVTIPEEGDADRLDRALARLLPDFSRSHLKTLIEKGRVSSDGAVVGEASYKVRPRQSFAIMFDEPEAADPVPQDIALTIVYEDDQLIVIDKPAGMVVHPAPGNRDLTLVNALLAHCGDQLTGIGGVARPGIVHRIDKDTSGLLVVAKTARAHAELSRQFAEHTVDRAYHAIVWGIPSPAEATIEGNIGRSPADRKRMAVLRKGGRTASTGYRVLAQYGSVAARVECRLLTGRTHQIRVHMAFKGHPLIGDPVYGRSDKKRNILKNPAVAEAVGGFHRQALHAVRLGFIHPTTEQFIGFDSSPPEDFQALVRSLEAL